MGWAPCEVEVPPGVKVPNGNRVPNDENDTCKSYSLGRTYHFSAGQPFGSTHRRKYLEEIRSTPQHFFGIAHRYLHILPLPSETHDHLDTVGQRPEPVPDVDQISSTRRTTAPHPACVFLFLVLIPVDTNQYVAALGARDVGPNDDECDITKSVYYKSSVRRFK